jgi:hypothetical protein
LPFTQLADPRGLAFTTALISHQEEVFGSAAVPVFIPVRSQDKEGQRVADKAEDEHRSLNCYVNDKSEQGALLLVLTPFHGLLVCRWNCLPVRVKPKCRVRHFCHNLSQQKEKQEIIS